MHLILGPKFFTFFRSRNQVVNGQRASAKDRRREIEGCLLRGLEHLSVRLDRLSRALGCSIV